MYKIYLALNVALLVSVPACLYVRQFVPDGFVMMNLLAVIAGISSIITIKKLQKGGRMIFKRLTPAMSYAVFLVLSFALISCVIAAMMIMKRADCHYYPFLSAVPFFIPAVAELFVGSINNIPNVKYSALLIDENLRESDGREASYQLIVRLILDMGGGGKWTINSKGAENVIFSQWIRRVINDYNSKYPYKITDMERYLGTEWRFYYYKFFIVKKEIDVCKSFVENGLYNNCRIYGKQIN